MALEQPWAITGPEITAATARQIAYQASGGNSGVAGSRDLLVRATSTPSNSVEVLPGSYVVTNINAAYQSYSGRNVGAELVEIPASGSSGSRTWYIGVELDDGDYSGNTLVSAEQVDTFEYAKFAVRGSLTATKKTFLPLAKITVPANTATITNSMIKSLRELSNPRRETVTFGRPRVSSDSEAGRTLNALTSAGGEYYPGGGGSPNQFQVEVPSWATRMSIRADWISNAYASNSNPYGSYWVEFGTEYRNHTWPNKRQLEFATQGFSFNSPGRSNDTMRMNWPLIDVVPVDSKLRGKEVTFAFKAGLSSSDYKGKVSMDGGSGLGMEITFVESAIDADTV